MLVLDKLMLSIKFINKKLYNIYYNELNIIININTLNAKTIFLILVLGKVPFFNYYLLLS